MFLALRNFITIIAAPTEAFEVLKEKPRWVIAFVVIAVVTIVVAFFYCSACQANYSNVALSQKLDSETVEALCDEVAIINKGKLVFQAKTKDIRKKIKDEVSQETYQSLEEIFIDVVSGNGEDRTPKKLSWL